MVFLRMVLDGIGRPVEGPTAILGDNSAMIELVSKEGASSRTRHFERATVLIKYAVLQGALDFPLQLRRMSAVLAWTSERERKLGLLWGSKRRRVNAKNRKHTVHTSECGR